MSNLPVVAVDKRGPKYPDSVLTYRTHTTGVRKYAEMHVGPNIRLSGSSWIRSTHFIEDTTEVC